MRSRDRLRAFNPLKQLGVDGRFGQHLRDMAMNYRYLIPLLFVAVNGCSGISKSKPDSMIASDSQNLGADNKVIITSRQQLPGNVGKVVTLRGKQSRTKLKTVLGIDVEGSDSYADQIVEVTGLLTSYEITQQEAEADQRRIENGIIAAQRPLYAGIHYRLSDPDNGDACQTRLLGPANKTSK